MAHSHFLEFHSSTTSHSTITLHNYFSMPPNSAVAGVKCENLVNYASTINNQVAMHFCQKSTLTVYFQFISSSSSPTEKTSAL